MNKIIINGIYRLKADYKFWLNIPPDTRPMAINYPTTILNPRFRIYYCVSY